MKLFVICLLICICFVSQVKSDACHPECKWKCGKPVCPAKCTPICERPKCEVNCHSLECVRCKTLCSKPICEVKCPEVSECIQGNCPDCQTICEKPRCKNECPEPEAECEIGCVAPSCSWDCEKPEKCPEPVCELVCEHPNTCSDDTGAAQARNDEVDALRASQEGNLQQNAAEKGDGVIQPTENTPTQPINAFIEQDPAMQQQQGAEEQAQFQQLTQNKVGEGINGIVGQQNEATNEFLQQQEQQKQQLMQEQQQQMQNLQEQQRVQQEQMLAQNNQFYNNMEDRLSFIEIANMDQVEFHAQPSCCSCSHPDALMDGLHSVQSHNVEGKLPSFVELLDTARAKEALGVKTCCPCHTINKKERTHYRFLQTKLNQKKPVFPPAPTRKDLETLKQIDPLFVETAKQRPQNELPQLKSVPQPPMMPAKLPNPPIINFDAPLY